MNIQWTPEARIDLRQAIDFIALDNVDAAEGVLDRILAAIENLRRFPSLGHVGRKPGTRELLIAGLPFVVPYAVTKGAIVILRVYHTSQDWPTT